MASNLTSCGWLPSRATIRNPEDADDALLQNCTGAESTRDRYRAIWAALIDALTVGYQPGSASRCAETLRCSQPVDPGLITANSMMAGLLIRPRNRADRFESVPGGLSRLEQDRGRRPPIIGIADDSPA